MPRSGADIGGGFEFPFGYRLCLDKLFIIYKIAFEARWLKSIAQNRSGRAVGSGKQPGAEIALLSRPGSLMIEGGADAVKAGGQILGACALPPATSSRIKGQYLHGRNGLYSDRKHKTPIVARSRALLLAEVIVLQEVFDRQSKRRAAGDCYLLCHLSSLARR